jgi:hypothetical protein
MLFNKATCRWTIRGEAEEVHRTDSRGKILTFLNDVRKVSGRVGPKEIAQQTDMSEDLVNKTLARMIEDDEVFKVSRGKYVSAARPDLLPK